MCHCKSAEEAGFFSADWCAICNLNKQYSEIFYSHWEKDQNPDSWLFIFMNFRQCYGCY